MPPTPRTAAESVVAPSLAREPRLASKFRNPAVPSDMVVRRRLLELVQQGAHRPLTLVSAPAGYGKTVLVTSWAARVRGPATLVHMTMDDGDENPTGFWTSALEGLRCSGLDVSGLRMTASSDVVDRPMLMRLAQRIAAHDEPVVWVLDCAESSLSPILGDGLHRVIRSCAGRLRVILLTRADPPLPLHRYRLDGAITEIRAADLAFTATEVATLLKRAGLDLAPVDVAALRARTAGWPAGLRFAAMSLAGRADTKQAIREFRGDAGNVAAYLMTEVLAKQPPETREFLLRTCLVDDLDPGLVGALTGQHCDPRVLQFMAHGNSFIEPVPGKHGCYRYQSLFREFLRSQLLFEKGTLVPALHRTAAEWLEQDGQWIAAIRHAVSAEAWPVAARYLVNHLGFGGMLTGPQRMLLRGLFARLPTDTEGPEAAVTRAALALTDLDSARGSSELATARTLLDRETAPPSQACELAIVVLEAVAASLGGDLDAGLDAALAAESALQLAPAEDVAEHPELKAIVAGCKGRVLLERGDFTAALTALTEGVKAAEGPHLGGVLADLQGMAALVEGMTGHLRRATELATRPGPGSDSAGRETASMSQAAITALAWVRMDEYDLQAAQDLVGYAEAAAPSYDARVLGGVLALVRARLQGAQGEFDLARAGLRAARSYSAPSAATGWLDRSLVVEQAASLLAQGQPERAITMIQSYQGCDHIECVLLLQQAFLGRHKDPLTLAQPSTTSLEAYPLQVQVQSWLVRAGQSINERDPVRGKLCLERALQLAAPEHLRRPFFDAPHDVRRLLERSGLSTGRRWLERPGPGPGTCRGVDGLSEQGQSWENGGRQAGATPIVNPLTSKEQEVLQYLADLMTTDEIAKAMFVSVNTVRSHVRSILRKLGVTRRNEAVRRAWELRLLPPRSAA